MEENIRRSEKAGIFNFTKEMVSALLMAFVFIVYVIQAFKIPTGSMKDSLLVGDFLLGLKFVYGAPVLPFTYAKFPGVTDPEPGDVIIFKYPGREKKDYIKRCVAGPGQRIRIEGKDVFVDDREVKLPPDGKYTRNGNTGEGIRNFEELYIPEKGDTIRVSECGLREFFFLRNLVHQEHPRKEVRAEYNLYVDGNLANNKPYVMLPHGPRTFQSIPFERIDNWKELDYLKTAVKVPMERDSLGNPREHSVKISKGLFLEDKPVREYVVENDNYFMLGDNRDNSKDSRYWGYLNRNFIKARAFIIYFSLKKDVPFYLLPLKIRWDRLGMLIRKWDGVGEDMRN